MSALVHAVYIYMIYVTHTFKCYHRLNYVNTKSREF